MNVMNQNDARETDGRTACTPLNFLLCKLSQGHYCNSSGQSDSGSVVFQVAWVRVDTQTILSIHHNVITQNPRISLSYNDHRSWYLHIKNVHEADRGWYMCQVNTDPMRSRQGYLQVVGEYYIAYVTDWVINLNFVGRLDTSLSNLASMMG